jgi:diacylglycerol kinase
MKRFLRSFYYAWKGIRIAFAEQSNLKIHAVVTLLVVFSGYYLGISSGEWLAVVLSIGFVLVAELLNTAIEYIVDLVSPEQQAKAGKVKDVAAGAVLMASITAMIVGFVVFKKYFFG